jgi:hypothetical protein
MGHRWTKISVQPVGEWGLLPNLDIVSVVMRLARTTGLRTVICDSNNTKYDPASCVHVAAINHRRCTMHMNDDADDDAMIIVQCGHHMIVVMHGCVIIKVLYVIC